MIRLTILKARMGDSKDDNVHSNAPSPAANLVSSNPNMPRSIRARVGATSDPIPKGKHLEEPKHHHRIVEEHHNPALTETEERTAGQEKEMQKDHIKEMQHARNEGGIDTKGKFQNPVMQSVGNKNMDSRQSNTS
ncbi:g2726 [Coccomyxa viridis]|uniref:G2726 protein n=1 Tax=Coccomyxa viridis TaxID=1274662 RepID=A0ABP1FRA6_9CHLO